MADCDILIVGAGAAGMTMAYTIWKKRPELKVILAERSGYLGGVLRQCLHEGFGKGYFCEELTGFEYAERLEAKLADTSVEVMLNTEVVQINEKEVWLAGAEGWRKIQFRKLVLATGSRERSIGSLDVWGTRPSGVFGAGQLQKMINLENYEPKKNAVILGSGDIGLILARRLILCGKTVKRIVEIQPNSPAMARNQILCLDRYQMPLQVNSTVTELHGKDDLCGVTLHDFRTGEDEYIDCDLLVVAAGLISERSLLDEMRQREMRQREMRQREMRQREMPQKEMPQWLHLYGNCEYIHSIADSISLRAEYKSQEILKGMEVS